MTMKAQPHNRRQFAADESGRTMLEMLAVLGIVGIIAITALIGFRYAMRYHRENESIDQMSKTIVGSRTGFLLSRYGLETEDWDDNGNMTGYTPRLVPIKDVVSAVDFNGKRAGTQPDGYVIPQESFRTLIGADVAVYVDTPYEFSVRTTRMYGQSGMRVCETLLSIPYGQNYIYTRSAGASYIPEANRQNKYTPAQIQVDTDEARQLRTSLCRDYVVAQTEPTTSNPNPSKDGILVFVFGEGVGCTSGKINVCEDQLKDKNGNCCCPPSYLNEDGTCASGTPVDPEETIPEETIPEPQPHCLAGDVYKPDISPVSSSTKFNNLTSNMQCCPRGYEAGGDIVYVSEESKNKGVSGREIFCCETWSKGHRFLQTGTDNDYVMKDSTHYVNGLPIGTCVVDEDTMAYVGCEDPQWDVYKPTAFMNQTQESEFASLKTNKQCCVNGYQFTRADRKTMISPLFETDPLYTDDKYVYYYKDTAYDITFVTEPTRYNPSYSQEIDCCSVSDGNAILFEYDTSPYYNVDGTAIPVGECIKCPSDYRCAWFVETPDTDTDTGTDTDTDTDTGTETDTITDEQTYNPCPGQDYVECPSGKMMCCPSGQSCTADPFDQYVEGCNVGCDPKFTNIPLCFNASEVAACCDSGNTINQVGGGGGCCCQASKAGQN
jgi:hypothetical protein